MKRGQCTVLLLIEKTLIEKADIVHCFCWEISLPIGVNLQVDPLYPFFFLSKKDHFGNLDPKPSIMV